MDFFKKQKNIFIVAVAIMLFFSILFLMRGKSEEFETIIAVRGDLVEEVNVTGRVEPTESVQLGFESGGRISLVSVRVGDSVKKGQTLVALENGVLQAELRQAEADLKAEEAKLEELERGTRQEDIAVQEIRVVNYTIALGDAKRNFIDKLEDSYTKADDVIRNKTDQFFKNPRSIDPKLSFTISDFNLTQYLESSRLFIESSLTSWRPSLDSLSVEDELFSHGEIAKEKLNFIKTFLERAGLALNSTSVSSSVSQTTLDGWKTDSSTARTNINTAINNITTAEEKLRTAESNLSLSQQELVLKKAGSAPEEIKAQEARVQSAEAKISNLYAQIAKTVLRSPFDGIVTLQDARVGEIVSGNQSIVHLIGASKFEIETYVPEADIAKIHLSDQSIVTLDAYGRGALFEAFVVAVAPSEAIIEGVTTYQTTLQFVRDDERIKSGMTANIVITTSKRDNAIFLPQRAISRKNGNTLVRTIESGKVEEILVETGIRSSGGDIEIVNGLTEGDVVITSLKD